MVATIHADLEIFPFHSMHQLNCWLFALPDGSTIWLWIGTSCDNVCIKIAWQIVLQNQNNLHCVQ